jgi:hypothetical protein
VADLRLAARQDPAAFVGDGPSEGRRLAADHPEIPDGVGVTILDGLGGQRIDQGQPLPADERMGQDDRRACTLANDEPPKADGAALGASGSDLGRDRRQRRPGSVDPNEALEDD